MVEIVTERLVTDKFGLRVGRDYCYSSDGRTGMYVAYSER